MKPERILLSPGPCTPGEAGILVPLIRHMAGKRHSRRLPRPPGHRRGLWRQSRSRANLMHGKTSAVEHDGKGIFAGLPTPLTCTRYHSLIVEAEVAARRT